MKKIINIFSCIIFLSIFFLLPLNEINAYESWSAYTNISGSLTVHSTPALGDFNWVEEIPPFISFRVIDKDGDFLKIVYGDDNRTGWVFNGSGSTIKKSSNPTTSYGRPWTTPGKSIIGGAGMIAESYINAGQYTSYLKKFQVNPNADANLYSHQYQTNIRAPWGEARTSYSAYSSYLSDITFTFSIPVYTSMPDATTLSGMTNKGTMMTAAELNDANFEAELTSQNFPESYKAYLRSLHKTYPKWKFKALHTNIKFNTAVSNEVPKSCIEVSSGHGTNDACGRESASWAMANEASVKYFMDPRNFLDKESIFMFEDLSSYENVTETMVQRILNNSFMSGKSSKDKKNYATLFMEAGKANNINPVYLASLVIQEVGRNGDIIQVNGKSFDWYGIRYSSLYNFYNIAATGTFTARGGLVWASGGSASVYEYINELGEIQQKPEAEIKPPTSLDTYLTKAGYKISGSYVYNIVVGTKVKSVKSKISGVNVTIKDSKGKNLGNDALISTGSVITLSNDETSYSKTIVISGDVDGDGKIGATDYVAIKNHIMEVTTLKGAYTKASDMNSNTLVDAGDYIAIKNYIMNN